MIAVCLLGILLMLPLFYVGGFDVMNGMNKPITVKAESLPLSMRHYSDDDALLQAECLAQLLQAATSALLKDGRGLLDGDCAYGLELVFSLLRDKLSVVSGCLKMPLASRLDDAPEWTPKKP